MAKIFELEKEITKQREILSRFAESSPSWISSGAIAHRAQNEKGRIRDCQSLRQPSRRA